MSEKINNHEIIMIIWSAEIDRPTTKVSMTSPDAYIVKLPTQTQDKTSFDARRVLMQDKLWCKTSFDARRVLMEDDLWWKTTVDGRQPLKKMTFNGRGPLMKGIL